MQRASTAVPPLSLIRVNGDESHCLVVVTPGGRPAARAIHPVEIVGQFELVDGQPNLDPAAFARGKDFTEFLHVSIARHGPSIGALVEAARGQHGSYVYVIDGRTPTPQGRVPPDDIIGSFHVSDGCICAQSYQRFEPHRLYTGRGFFQLEPALIEGLLADLEAVQHG